MIHCEYIRQGMELEFQHNVMLQGKDVLVAVKGTVTQSIEFPDRVEVFYIVAGDVHEKEKQLTIRKQSAFTGNATKE